MDAAAAERVGHSADAADYGSHTQMGAVLALATGLAVMSHAGPADAMLQRLFGYNMGPQGDAPAVL